MALADALRAQSVDVLHVVDTNLRGAADDEVLAEAARLGRVLVSFNVRDFQQLTRAWASEGHEQAGVILVPAPGGIGELVRRLVERLDKYARSACAKPSCSSSYRAGTTGKAAFAPTVSTGCRVSRFTGRIHGI